MLTATDRGTIDRLVRDLKGHEQRKVVLAKLRSTLREPLPRVRVAVRAAAVQMLPRQGGLGTWVAASRVGLSVRVTSRSVRVTVRAGRRSDGAKSDIDAIDRGNVRHPVFGSPLTWSRQTVPAGFFSTTLTEGPLDWWRAAAVKAAEQAVDDLSNGG